MNAKVFFVLVALLVIAAAVGLAAGVFGPQKGLDLKFGGLDQLGSSLMGDPALGAADIQSANPAGCMDLFKQGSLALKTGQSCVFTVKTSDRPSRKVSLAVPAGQNLRLAARMPLNDNQNQLNLKKTLAAPTPAELQFFKDGGTLTLWCETPGLNSGCLVTVKK